MQGWERLLALCKSLSPASFSLNRVGGLLLDNYLLFGRKQSCFPHSLSDIQPTDSQAFRSKLNCYKNVLFLQNQTQYKKKCTSLLNMLTCKKLPLKFQWALWAGQFCFKNHHSSFSYRNWRKAFSIVLAVLRYSKTLNGCSKCDVRAITDVWV